MKKPLIALNLASITLASSMFVSMAYADDAIKGSAVVTEPSATLNANVEPATQEVYLMNPHLTPRKIHNFSKYKLAKDAPVDATKENVAILSNIPDANSTSKLPTKILVDITRVPVLNQGKHGACVTFANTAALDILLDKGDYISQLCNLELGDYIEDQSVTLDVSGTHTYPSGWDGSMGPFVLNQIFNFGFVSKQVQQEQSCSGVTKYPQNDPDNTGNPMTIDEFKLKRESLPFTDTKIIYWDALLSYEQRFAEGGLSLNNYRGNKALAVVKRFLAETNSSKPDDEVKMQGVVTFGVLLPVDACKRKVGVGACAKYHAAHDSWVLTARLQDDLENLFDKFSFGGHEMVIVGYDDNAVAVDEKNVKHKGLLILRNSWGTKVGDKGNYYMSYDFFKKFTDEIQLLFKIDGPIFSNT